MKRGERIKRRREELGLTQEELAKRLGYKGKSAISRIESAGDGISFKIAEKLAPALETTPEALFGISIDKKNVIFDSTRDIYAMRIAEKAAQLSTEQQHQVMDFINYLKGKNK